MRALHRCAVLGQALCVGACAVALLTHPADGASITSLPGAAEAGLRFFEVAGATQDFSVIAGTAHFIDGSLPKPYRWTPDGGYQGLGSITGNGSFGSAQAVSADGRVIVGQIFFAGNKTAFRWTAEEGMRSIAVESPVAFDSMATAVSADGGVIAGWLEIGGQPQAFRWTAATGMKRLVEAAAANDTSEVFGVSIDGSVIVGTMSTGFRHDIFRWTEAEGLRVVGEGQPYGSVTIRGMTPEATTIVGSRELHGKLEAFRWSKADGMTIVAPIENTSDWSTASAVSADGNVVVGVRSNDEGYYSFIWTVAGGAQLLLPPSGFSLYPEIISANGHLILGSFIPIVLDGQPQGQPSPWVWTPDHDLRPLEDELVKNYGLDIQDIDLSWVRAISGDGVAILGGGDANLGNPDLWIARLEGCRDTQEVPVIAGAGLGPLDPAAVLVLDGSGSKPGPGEAGNVTSFQWEVISGPATLLGAGDGPTVEVHTTDVGEAVVRLTVDDGVCANPASAIAVLHFCDVKTAGNAMFLGLCDFPWIETPRLSADGKVLLGQRENAQHLGLEALRWTEIGSAQGLGGLASWNPTSRATGLSRDGSVVVGVSFSLLGPADVFRWTAQGGMVDLRSVVDLASGEESVAVSADGSLLAWSSGGLPWYWTEETGLRYYASFGAAPHVNVKGMSDDGSILLAQGRTAAYRLPRDGALQQVGDLLGGETISVGNDLSADGSVVVGWSDSGRGPEAILWTPVHGSRGLGDLPGGAFSSEALAVTGDGRVVVGTSESSAGPEAFIWDAERGMRSLKGVLEGEFGFDLSRWQLTAATDISADSWTITGRGIDPTGSPQVWIARLDLCGDPPEIARIEGAPPKAVSTNVPVELDGGGSSAVPGEGNAIASFLWEIVSGPGVIEGPSDLAHATIRGVAPGSVRVRLSVDDAGCGVHLARAEAEFTYHAPSAGNWLLGDANGDTRVDLSDAVFTLSHLFLGGTAPACVESIDTNSDGRRDISDAVYTLTYLFAGGPQPATPYPECGNFAGCADLCP